MKKTYNKIGTFFLLLGLVFLWSCPKENSRPNILLILADDMGYSDLGCTGGEIATPNLDRLAAQGLLFTHCYNTARCCPTRASLLTGRYQHSVGIGHMDADLGWPSYRGRLDTETPMMAGLLQEQGYQTYMLGKWHLGDEPEHSPLGRGFDRMYGIPKGGGVYFYPCIGRDRQVFLDDEQVFPDSNWYSTDAFTDYAIQFVRESQRQPEQPFFMYLAYIAPHFPLQARQEDIAKYAEAYEGRIGSIREKRYRKQQRLGIVDVGTLLPPMESFKENEGHNPEEEQRKMAVYAAQVDRMDQNIGRLLEVLQELGQLDNTIVMFLSDNGAASVNLNDTPDAEIGSRNCWASYGKARATVSNTPYREHKARVHEGGIITPLIVHWPVGIRRPGEIRKDPVHIIDLLPTCLEVSGRPTGGGRIETLPGQSLVSTLNSPGQTERTLFWEHQGNQAVRYGKWKLVRLHRRDWELYDLEHDPTEMQNLVRQNPAKARELETEFAKWAEQNGVLPWPVKKKK